ncbi:hypothetical protein G7Y41_02490 [Schaalia sp. ZJ405]|uniref:DUF5719 family protein n=1 Tax=Schaalia sp. ZJ405 TaxID=2709403 RepID=UPI0013EA4C90|nr:DUF5719 family protein [Schaalia sp. ZJ405]QPK81724.1 hypothetical protein G7Y41_02490 [Schaalia sp. ZJ405]
MMRTEGHSMRFLSPRILIALAAVLSLAGIAVGVSVNEWLPLGRDGHVPSPQREASPTSMTLACPPGIIDPFSTLTASTPSAIWSNTPVDGENPAQGTRSETSSPLSKGAGQLRTVTSQASEDGRLTLPSGVTIAGQGGGELVGISATGCAAPSAEQWIVAGSTVVGEDLVLVLANPADSASVVSISGYSGGGLIDPTPQQVTVPAGTTLAVLVAGWYPDAERLALRVSADGPGVVAWAQSSGMSGEVPLGNTWLPSVRPSTTNVIGGIDPKTTSTLRVAVPGDSSAHVELSAVTAGGTTSVPGGSVEVDGHTVLDIPLGGIGTGEDTYALVVSSDVPVAAQVRMRDEGEAWPGGGQSWETRATVSPSTAVTSARLPGASVITDLVTRQLDADPVRPTSIPTPSGALEVKAKLVVVADEYTAHDLLSSASSDSGSVSQKTLTRDTDTDQSGGQSAGSPQSGGGESTPVDTAQSAGQHSGQGASGGVMITYGGHTHTIAAGTTMTLDLASEDAEFTSNAPVRIIVEIQASTPVGTVRGAWPVGTLGLATQGARVSVDN